MPCAQAQLGTPDIRPLIDPQSPFDLDLLDCRTSILVAVDNGFRVADMRPECGLIAGGVQCIASMVSSAG
jgi:hypothetical protein